MENRQDNTEYINLRIFVKRVFSEKKLFYKTIPATFILSCLYIICIPRYYNTSISLAPEVGGVSASGTLGSIASSFGIDLNDMQSSDAISPLLYPDLMDDNGFVVSLFPIRVKSVDGKIDCNYYDYLHSNQKKAWWIYPITWVKNLFKEESSIKSNIKEDPYILNKTQDDVVQAIKQNIEITVDKKTAVISISVQAQDQLICKTLADSVKEHLQLFITDYRTNKARIDEKYYQHLTAEAKSDYDKARKQYAAYADANTNVTLESYRIKLDDLENEMQLKYNTYSTLMAQYQAAKAKVQERTPAFTVVKGAAVPVKPTGPKRMLFVLGMTILAFIGTIGYILKDELVKTINK